jgi:hypothetical protein
MSRAEPACASTAEVLADSGDGTELRFSFDWKPCASEGVLAGRTAIGEPVRASYRPAHDTGAPLGDRAWRGVSAAPGSYSVLVCVPDRGAIETDVLSWEGTPAASGVYFIRVETPEDARVGRAVLLK